MNNKEHEFAVELFFRVKKNDVYLYQFLFEGYDNVGLVSAYKSGDIIRILTTKDQKELSLNIMNSLKNELEFEILDESEAENIKYWFRTKEGELK